MSEKPDKAEGTHSDPDGHSGFGDHTTAEDFSVFDLERPDGYQGHSQGPPQQPPGHDDGRPVADLPTYEGDPYDYGDTDRNVRGPAQQAEPCDLSGAEAPPVLDREMLARELATDRARDNRSRHQPRADAAPTSEVPRTRATIPWHQHDDRSWSPSPTGQQPVAPRLSRILGDGAGADRRGGWPDEGSMAPFTPMPSTPSAPAPRLELVLDAAYRWRTALGVGMAALMTLAVVVAYRPKTDGTDAADDRLAVGADGQSAIDGVTDFGDDSALDAPLDGNGGNREVESQVGGRSTTTSPPTTQRPATTVDKTPAETNPTPTAGPDPTQGPTSTIAPEPTPAPTTSSTVDTVPPAPILREVEDGALLGTARVRSDFQGYSGNGFVGDIVTEASGVTVTFENTTARTATYTIRYATPGQGPAGDRSLALIVNNGPAVAVVFPPTASVTTWETVTGTVEFTAGTNTVTLVHNPDDTGWVNLDYVEIAPPAS